LVITNTTASVSYNTGALQVAGGVGIGGPLYTNSTTNIGGSLTAGQTIVDNTTPSTVIGTGALQVKGGASVVGNLYVGNAISPQQYVENISTGNTWASALSISYNNGMFYYITGPGATTITSLSISNVPNVNNTSYTFTFMLDVSAATVPGNCYINANNGFRVNGAAVALRGNTNIAGNLGASPAVILQQITVYYISSTFRAITSAMGF